MIRSFGTLLLSTNLENSAIKTEAVYMRGTVVDVIDEARTTIQNQLELIIKQK